MKRFLNEVRTFEIEPLNDEYKLRFKLKSASITPSEKELFIGTYSGNSYLMVFMDNKIHFLP